MIQQPTRKTCSDLLDCRKIERSMWTEGNSRNRRRRRRRRRRRSPRLTAIEACKESPHEIPGHSDSRDCKEPPSRTRTTSVKRKLLDEAASDAVSIEAKHGGDSLHHKDQPKSCGKPIQLPEKRILELILDTLQRRDINELFAEPVDPSEVEDYYEIVKEPMDFGTMRAKLHEGMYQNLEQFEHDVFLIPTNAMQFNSSGSIYFRQARVICELAKKVFHVLETDPENFEAEFSGARRRSIRKAASEMKASRQSLDPISGITSKDISLKGIQSSLCDPSVSKRSKGSQLTHAATTRKNNFDSYSDARKNRRQPQPAEADRRCTYRPLSSPLGFDNSSMDSRIYSNWGPTLVRCLPLINQQDFSYEQSLMTFIKDLGPTAEVIAKKKLKRWPENPGTCQIPSSNCSLQEPPHQASTSSETACWRFLHNLPLGDSVLETPGMKNDLTSARSDTDVALSNSRIGDDGAVAYRNTEAKLSSTKLYDKDVVRISKRERDKVTRKCKIMDIGRGFSSWNNSGAGDLHYSSSVRKKNATTGTSCRFPEAKLGDADDDDRSCRPDDSVLPVVLALEHSRPDACELKTRNSKKKSTEAQQIFPSNQGRTSSGSSVSVHEATAPNKPVEEDAGDVIMMSLSRRRTNQISSGLSKKSSMPSSFSRFTFDMPFLKAQLNQMTHHVGQDGSSKLIHQRVQDTDNNKGTHVSFEQGKYEGEGAVAVAVGCSRHAQEPSTTHPFPNLQYNYNQYLVWRPSPYPLGNKFEYS